jgi:hypothetical protein
MTTDALELFFEIYKRQMEGDTYSNLSRSQLAEFSEPEGVGER